MITIFKALQFTIGIVGIIVSYKMSIFNDKTNIAIYEIMKATKNKIINVLLFILFVTFTILTTAFSIWCIVESTVIQNLLN